MKRTHLLFTKILFNCRIWQSIHLRRKTTIIRHPVASSVMMKFQNNRQQQKSATCINKSKLQSRPTPSLSHRESLSKLTTSVKQLKAQFDGTNAKSSSTIIPPKLNNIQQLVAQFESV
jgi:hypothetical protein